MDVALYPHYAMCWPLISESLPQAKEVWHPLATCQMQMQNAPSAKAGCFGTYNKQI